MDRVTIWRWVQRYAPILNQRFRRDLRHPNRSWRVDETYVRVAGTWTYLYRAVDSAGETIDFMLSPKRDLPAAKLFQRLALSGSGHHRYHLPATSVPDDGITNSAAPEEHSRIK